jgi:hypothetical protein
LASGWTGKIVGNTPTATALKQDAMEGVVWVYIMRFDIL